MNDVEKNLQRKRDNFDKRKKESDKLYEEIKEIEEKKHKKEAFIEARKELACAQMHYHKEVHYQKKQNTEKLINEREAGERSLLQLHMNNKAVNDVIATTNKKIDAEKNKFAKQTDDLDIVRRKDEDLKIRMKELECQIRETESEKDELNKEKDFKSSIFKSRTDPQEISERNKRKEQKALRLKEAEEEIQLSHQNVVNEGDKLEVLRKQENQIGKEILGIRKEIENMSIAIRNAEHQKTEIERSTRNRVSMYGRNAYLIDKGLKEFARHFKETPIGPVSMYVRLKPDVPHSYASIIESFLGLGLQSYLCDNSEDRRKLFQLFDSKGIVQKPKVFTSTFLKTRHDQSTKFCRVRSHFKPLIDMLEVNDMHVYNFLIDEYELERKVICEAQDQAKRITSKIENVPEHLNLALTKDGYKFFPPTKKSSYRSYYMDIRESKFLNAEDINTNGLVREKEEEIRNMRTDLKKVRQQLDKAEKEVQFIQSDISNSLKKKAAANQAYDKSRQIKMSVLSEDVDDHDE